MKELIEDYDNDTQVIGYQKLISSRTQNKLSNIYLNPNFNLGLYCTEIKQKS
jgi:hypothetical protein